MLYVQISMNIMFLFFILLVGVQAITIEDAGKEWEEFQRKFKRVYSSESEKSQRMAIFWENLIQYENHNILYEHGKETYKMGVNRFTDWSNVEFVKYLGKHNAPDSLHPIFNRKFEKVSDIPDNIDWRDKGAVTNVKDQGSCTGGDYAFASAALLESRYQFVTGRLENISSQHLLDCSNNNGCSSGTVPKALLSLEFEGIERAKDYPFVEKSGDCQYNRLKAILSTTGPAYLPKGEEFLTEEIANVGPVVISIAASPLLQGYVSGIFSDDDCDLYPHKYMLVVGYGSENGTDYYIIKNSWGVDWGEKGYLRLARNKGNMCSVSSNGYSCNIIPPKNENS